MALARYRSLVCLVLLAGLAGCVADAPAEPTPDVAPETAPAVDSVAFDRGHSGLVVLRAGSDEPPLSMDQGDPHVFCFLVPPDTVHWSLAASWNTAQPVGVEVFAPGAIEPTHMNYDRSDPTTWIMPQSFETSDAEPRPGEWFFWIGPLIGPAYVPWEATFHFEVARAGASVQETLYEGDPCT